MEVLTDDKKTPIANIDQGGEGDKWLEMFSLFIHDLEPSLASMKYILKLLEGGKLDLKKTTHRDMVSSAGVAVKRAETIIFDIMAVARSGKMGLPVSMTVLNPQALVDEAAGLARVTAAEYGLSIIVREDGSLPLVKADPILLARTLDNFVFNAMRHTPAGGEVMIYTTTEKKSFYIHVKDTGPGLDDIEPHTLFEKFGQFNLRSSGKHRGVGLGLYFCKLAATGMGGAVMADDHPDGGAVFSIKLQKAGRNNP